MAKATINFKSLWLVYIFMVGFPLFFFLLGGCSGFLLVTQQKKIVFLCLKLNGSCVTRQKNMLK